MAEAYKFPDKLRLVDGELVCADGSDVREYLREYAEKVKIGPDEPMVLMRRSVAENHHKWAMMAQHWAS